MVPWGPRRLSEQSIEPFNPPAATAEGRLEWVWTLLLAAAAASRSGASATPGSFGLSADGELRLVALGSAAAVLASRDGVWVAARALPPDCQALLDLYLPVCSASAAAPLTVAHLGQSLDGYIATGTGDSNYVTGRENILHLHRMRALCDAIVVGAGTIAADDPRLTTRLANGSNPVRVILDPRLRLPPRHRVFDDGEAPSLLVCSTELAAAAPGRLGHAEILGVPYSEERLDLAAVVGALRARGLYRIFVEGGGTTVSRFLEAGLLDRLQIAIAPLVIGRGRPGLRLPANERIAQCLRPGHRVFRMGEDILFDCDIRNAEPPGRSAADEALARIG
jgi:diaminohydroxyphosphoribosylaminopyrimidine deaminase / 5-amino-6-(5-phosphoribosylamino)uracil reductase